MFNALGDLCDVVKNGEDLLTIWRRLFRYTNRPHPHCEHGLSDFPRCSRFHVYPRDRPHAQGQCALSGIQDRTHNSTVDGRSHRQARAGDYNLPTISRPPSMTLWLPEHRFQSTLLDPPYSGHGHGMPHVDDLALGLRNKTFKSSPPEAKLMLSQA